MMEGKMKRVDIAAICSAVICLAVSTVLHGAKAEEQKVTRVRMTIDELRAQGIAVRGITAQPFPNSCRSSGNARLSVPAQLLEHFKGRGFTLESVCLGLSSRVRFDPETGSQLPLAFVPEIRGDRYDQEFPLNLPLCFRNAVSDLECDYKFDSWWGNRLDRHDLTSRREFSQKFDAMVRQHIQRNRISGVFKVEDLGQGLFTSSYEWLLASSALRRGYGYALHGPEGDDPEVENVNLSTYRKKSGGSSLWSD
jgi:hypothetical protein